MAMASSGAAHGSEGTGSVGLTTLPKDILGHILALMPLRDAARAACVSRGFLRSWRCYPWLEFDMDTLGFFGLEDPFFYDDDSTGVDELGPIIEDQMKRGIITLIEDYYKKNDRLIREFAARVDHIMQHHSGTGVKTFRVRPPHGFYISPAILDRWVRDAITPGTITSFELLLAMGNDLEEDGQIVGRYYSFPCSLLSSKTIIYLSLAGCSLHSAHTAGCLPSLTTLCLQNVRVATEELGCFLSNTCPALELLEVSVCDDMVCLKIPRLLSRLKLLLVRSYDRYESSLQMIECHAPKLKSFRYVGTPMVHVSLGPSVREMRMSSGMEAGGMLFYATNKLPSTAPNLRSLYLASCFELEMPEASMHESIPHGDSTQQKRQRHRKLKKVVIRGFCLAKGMVELTSHILKNATSMKHLILDTTYGCDMSYCKARGCLPLTIAGLLEARNALDVIKTYIEGKVPSRVKFEVIEPCTKCHTDAACRR